MVVGDCELWELMMSGCDDDNNYNDDDSNSNNNNVNIKIEALKAIVIVAMIEMKVIFL